jgi:hypothetical protein
MSATTNRGSRTTKSQTKSAAHKPVPKKAAPPVKKKTMPAKSSPRVEPVKKSAAVPAKPKAAKVAASPVKAVPAKTPAPAPKKKAVLIPAEEPKKKIVRAAAEKAPVTPPKDKPVKAVKEETPPAEIKVKSGRPPKIVAEKPAEAPKPRGRRKLSEAGEAGAGEKTREKPPSTRAPKVKNFEPDDEFIDEDPLAIDEEEDILIPPDAIELDPLEIPLELLDPELVEVPRPTIPNKPKPRPVKSERKPQKCAQCGGMFPWLSVDGLCFNCLKKKLAARKREDESYSSGFGGSSESEDDSDSSD